MDSSTSSRISSQSSIGQNPGSNAGGFSPGQSTMQNSRQQGQRQSQQRQRQQNASRGSEIRLDTDAEAERLRLDERARRLEQARMEGINEARREEQQRRQEAVIMEQQRQQAEQKRRQEAQIMEQQRQQAEYRRVEATNNAIAASDDSYIPPQTVLDSKSLGPLLEQVDGPSMFEYEGKEKEYSSRTTKVFGTSTLDIPVRVVAPGSIVEYTIEKKKYDFGLGISAKLDQGGVTVVKVRLSKRSRNGRAF